MASKLYIIGNGFDMHHGIKSGYSNYRKWLEENDSDLYERLREYYDVDDDEWWWQFEQSLGYPDMSDYIEQTAFENEPDYGSDDFRDRDYHAGQFQAEDEIGGLVQEIRDSFTEWVASLSLPLSDKKISLDKEDAYFINFNYTDTLQSVYNVSDENILSIHGNVTKGTDLVLGHNRTYDEINTEYVVELPEPPADLNDEDLAEWYDNHSDDGEGYIHQSVRGEVVSQISSLRKNTAGIILANKKIFESLKDVKHIFVYGLSFSSIDTPYIDELISHIDKDTVQWKVSYLTEDDLAKEQAYFKLKGIKSSLLSYIKLDELLLVKQTEIPFEDK